MILVTNPFNWNHVVTLTFDFKVKFVAEWGTTILQICLFIIKVHLIPTFFDRLDKALIRPGRADLKELIDYATDHQIGEMFRRFYPDQGDDVVSKFIQDIRKHDSDVSVAQLQGLFLQFKDDPVGVCNNTELIWSS